MSLLPIPLPLSAGRLALLGAVILGASLAFAGTDLSTRLGFGSRLGNLPRTVVRRESVQSLVLSPGAVASSENTEIRCQLERLESAGSAAMSAGGASTILSLVPDGSMVEANEILCELDGSDFQELIRRQQIVVEQARADHLQATLTRDVAQMALEAYREGEQLQMETQFKGQIALARSDVERQADRMAWNQRMLDKGYASVAQVATDGSTELRLKESLRSMQMSLDNYQRFTAPMTLMSYQKQVNGAESTLRYQDVRLKREEDRLAHYQKLADRCVIRAPHRGFVIHANRPGRDPQVYEGAPVRERMMLFTLPDLSKMEVQVMLHETVMNRVRPGMPARVEVDALGGRIIEGRVDSIGPMPVMDQNSRTANQIAYFIAHVRLSNLPQGLRPGMSAATTILCDERSDALTVPMTAVAVEDGRNVCYVLRDDRLERREVTVAPADHELYEISDGLKEGDVVALDPAMARSGHPG